MILERDMDDPAAFSNTCKKIYITTDLWAWCFEECPRCLVQGVTVSTCSEISWGIVTIRCDLKQIKQTDNYL